MKYKFIGGGGGGGREGSGQSLYSRAALSGQGPCISIWKYPLKGYGLISYDLGYWS